MTTPRKNAVAKAEGIAPPATAPSEAAAILSMIERFARDPSVDLDRLERLMNMQREATERTARSAFVSALAELQPELPTITEKGGIKDRNGNVQSTYAKWDDINEAIRPVLAAHGFALTFKTDTAEARVTVTGFLNHREGHSEQTTISLPLDASGSKNAVQAVGSSISYGKRYAAIALLNITSRAPQDKDDDGHAAGLSVSITDDQAAELRDLMTAVGAKEAAFCKLFLKGQPLDEMPLKRFNEAVAELKAFGRERGIRV